LVLKWKQFSCTSSSAAVLSDDRRLEKHPAPKF
jgi:hypothetical protein